MAVVNWVMLFLLEDRSEEEDGGAVRVDPILLVSYLVAGTAL